MKITREFGGPNKDTFSIKPIAAFVQRFYKQGQVVIDPFARSSTYGTYTNDLNPSMPTQYHLEAREFLDVMIANGVVADLILFDPPYSPRQISEVYQGVGRKVAMEDTQNARLYKECRERFAKLAKPGTVLLSFGWNSTSSGTQWKFEEILIVNHGAAHNDTICRAEVKL